MSQTQTQQGQQHLDEGEWLRQRLGAPEWGAAEWALFGGVLASYKRMLTALLEAQITVTRLRTLLFGTRRRRKSSGAGPSAADAGAAADSRGEADVGVGESVQVVHARYASGDGSPPDDVRTSATGGHRPGYGRLGAEAYTGAERVECRHEELAVGQICPVCGQGR